MRPDVIIYDEVGAPFSPQIAEQRGLGGVECNFLALADALAMVGYNVLVLNTIDANVPPVAVGAGEVAYSHVSRAWREKLSCEAIVVSRWSQVSPVQSRRVVFSAHDIPAPWLFRDHRRQLDAGAPIVCVSSWQAGKIAAIAPAWRCEVISPMLLDASYERDESKRVRGKFVYASAAIKGLPQTIDTWALMHDLFTEMRYMQLCVATNGYDGPSARDTERMRWLGVHALGQLTAKRIIEELRSAEGLFFVNSFPETFGIVPAAAQALGCRCHVLCLDDPGALPDTLEGITVDTSRSAFIERFAAAYLTDEKGLPLDKVPDRRAAALLPAWERVLFEETGS